MGGVGEKVLGRFLGGGTVALELEGTGGEEGGGEEWKEGIEMEGSGGEEEGGT